MARHLLADEDEARIEIIPMIDIMMFLLVFFVMATLKMITNAGITQNLPGNAVPQEEQKIDKLIVGVAADGTLTLNGAPLAAAGLEPALRQARQDEASKGQAQVLIAAQKQADLQAVMHVADAVRHAGIQALGIATQADSLPSAHGAIR
ncbi:biopolymer transporter ExbD [Paraburkholderia sp.]|uniref:ExbD/TolR family protein n=1 Tax=Paraburkholderia sp. TaxID=1926495 RepID=UPI002382ACEC|nr:biopolymer transporter ExbD [Paraburkholderia sp.]MDE1181867.1 biopolymer transporter ExbD [Paraburkholderia sp.]